jgi:hypothetical protein
MPMKQGAYCVFETALGWCGIAWSERGDSGAPPAVTCLQLPEATAVFCHAEGRRKTKGKRTSHLFIKADISIC